MISHIICALLYGFDFRTFHLEAASAHFFIEAYDDLLIAVAHDALDLRCARIAIHRDLQDAHFIRLQRERIRLPISQGAARRCAFAQIVCMLQMILQRAGIFRNADGAVKGEGDLLCFR